MELDDADIRLLRCWQNNPQASVAQLSDLAGMSNTPCWRRMRKLEEAGVVTGRALLIDTARVGLDIDVFAHVRLEKHDEETLNALEAELQACPQIIECFSMSGESDFLLRIIVASITEYEHFLKQTLLHMPGISSVNSSFSLKRIKATTKLPI